MRWDVPLTIQVWKLTRYQSISRERYLVIGPSQICPMKTNVLVNKISAWGGGCWKSLLFIPIVFKIQICDGPTAHSIFHDRCRACIIIKDNISENISPFRSATVQWEWTLRLISWTMEVENCPKTLIKQPVTKFSIVETHWLNQWINNYLFLQQFISTFFCFTFQI